MLKKRLLIIGVSIICIISLLFLYKNNNEKLLKKDGIIYAINVDGKSVKDIPSKGLYKVDVGCDNATCIWDYDEWMLRIRNITGEVTCGISFNTISKTNLNDKVIGLSGTEQVVHETFIRGDYTNATSLTQSEYGTTSQYYGTSNSSTSGTAVTNAFIFNGTEWVSQPSNMTSGKYYHINFIIPTDGNYQLCYELSSGNTGNYLYIYQGTNEVYINGSYYINASATSPKSGCVDLGHVTSGTQYRAVQRAASKISTLKISIKKTNKTETINTGYRYEGKSPNNWVWFNNELWRIIGVFDSNTHGVTNTNLVKIIRSNSIGALVWDKSNTNDWSNSSLMNLLNGAYYKKQNGTGGEYCYSYSTSVPGNCDYSNIGIDASYRKMIKEVTWKLGGYTISATAETLYIAERGSATGNSNEYSATKSGYIGLMYPSDYGYSVLSSSCARTTNLRDYSTSTCAGQSWLWGNGNEWTITPSLPYSRYVFSVYSNGSLNANDTYGGYTVRPTLYLNENVYVVDGTGAEADPYIIGMD